MTRYLAILIGLIAALVPAGIASADPAQPDSAISINTTNYRAYTNLIEGADLLVIAEYNIPYATLPSDSADVNFIAQLYLSDDTLIGNDVPYPFNDQGYGKGVVSFYLDAGETQAAGLSNGTTMTAWPIVGLYTVLQGNPAIWVSVPTTGTQTLASGAYTADQTRDTNQDDLGAKILQIASVLQAAWQVTLLTDSNVLNGTGTQYFNLAIPGIRSLTPGIYDISSSVPAYPTPQPTPGSGTYADTAENRYAGIYWIPDNPMLKAFFSFLVVVAAVSILGIFFGSPGAVIGIGFSFMVLTPIAMDQGFLRWGYGALIIASLTAMGITKFAREQIG